MAERIRQRSRPFGLLAIVVVAALALGACNPQAEDQDFALINSLRANIGVAQLSRSAELNTKAHGQADRMANRGRIYHSSNLASGVSAGWRSSARTSPSPAASNRPQSALEQSPGHLANMVNGQFTEVGIGVTVQPWSASSSCRCSSAGS